eukprot:1157847-Pelagomonas_calceolata.AAC.4
MCMCVHVCVIQSYLPPVDVGAGCTAPSRTIRAGIMEADNTGPDADTTEVLVREEAGAQAPSRGTGAITDSVSAITRVCLTHLKEEKVVPVLPKKQVGERAPAGATHQSGKNLLLA